MERLRIKNLLLACTVMLGLQFCFPLVVQADDAGQVAEMISLGTKDPENKSDVHLDILLTTPFLLTLVVHLAQDTPSCPQLAMDDRGSSALLPVSGVQPSAP